MRHKLPAFTLFELMLGMLLSAVVIGMVYSAWFLFSGVYREYMADGADRREVLAFRRVLDDDLLKARSVYVRENRVSLLDSSSVEALHYIVLDSGVLRKGARLDTFLLGRSVLQGEFEGQLVTDSLADRVSFRLLLKGHPVSVTAHKYYSSSDLFSNR